MAAIDPKYSIGIPEMDAQHARWIELIDAFRAAACEHLADLAGIDAAEQALVEMAKYTRHHFASEERFMADHGYPDLDAHRQRHAELEAQVASMLEAVRSHKTCATPLKLNLFITVWLYEHIMSEDRAYARFTRDAARPPLAYAAA